MTAPIKILLDNTVLTNYAIVGRPDLIFLLFGDHVSTVKQVIHEYEQGAKNPDLPVDAWEKLPVSELTVDEVDLG